MSRLELLVVCASLDEPPARRLVEDLGRRHLVDVATAAPAEAAAPRAELEVRRFALAPPAHAEPRGASFAGAFPAAMARARARGPWSPALLEFLHHEHSRYRAVVFLSYASPLTVFGLPLVPERAILVPQAAGGADLADPPYVALFHLPRAIGYADERERDRVQVATRNEQVPYELMRSADASAALDRLLAVALHG